MSIVLAMFGAISYEMVDQRFFRGDTWGFPGSAVEHIETHAAHVFLCGDRAFKIKKNVKLPYLDFSSIERRRSVIENELVVNLVFAPDIYLNVTEKYGEPVLVMKRFPAEAILSRMVTHSGIEDQLSAALAAAIADSHRKAAVANISGADVMVGLGQQLSKAFHDSPDVFSGSASQEFNTLYDDLLDRFTALLNARSQDRLVRRCHGDMHCGNIVVIDQKPVLFDAIEFSEKIATIDVLYDLAFLLMDLMKFQQRRAACVILNTYLNLRRAEEDLAGLAVLPLFLATRAGVRALVTADLVHELDSSRARKQRDAAQQYFADCVNFLKPKKARLICVGGLSGTGKTTLARSLAPNVDPPPGAIHIRSDVERKTLAGVAETQHLPEDHYTQANSLKVYEAVLARARKALSAGHSVVIDAVFGRESERIAAEALAQELGLEFRGLWLEGKIDVLKRRLVARVHDASDATPEVLDAQTKQQHGEITWAKIDASQRLVQVEASAKRLT
jgi:uncharacterized protein